MTTAAETGKAIASRLLTPWVLALGGGIVILASFLRALELADRLAQTSDSAQGLVAGHAVAGGNLLLSGWHFPFNDYYFTDTIPYGALEWIVGARPRLLAVVPALVYGLFVAAAILACVRRSQAPARNAESLGLIAFFFATPVWIGSWNPLFFSDMHVATTLGAFVALALSARLPQTKSAAGWISGAAGVLVLTATTVASDPYALVFAFAPALVVLTGDAISAPRTGGALAVVALGVAAGFALPRAIALGGGFTTEKDVLFGLVAMPLLPRNLAALLAGLLQNFGIAAQGELPAPRVVVLFILRGIGFAIAVGALLCTLARAFGRNRAPLFDRLLGAGILTVICACTVSEQFAKGIVPREVWAGGPPMRYLVPVYLFVAVLAARRVPDLLEHLPARAMYVARLALLLIAAIALAAGSFFSGAAAAPRWIGDNRPATLARWLERQGLAQGVGEYWSANLVTAVSGDRVRVRSVVPDHGRLVPYVWVEDATWFAQSPQFVVWQEPNKTGLTAALVHATYDVCRTTEIAGYRVAFLKPNRTQRRQPGRESKCADAPVPGRRQ